MALIYGLFNRSNGFVYIGCTSGNMAKRLREHRCLLRKGVHSAVTLQKDWKNQDESSFYMERIEDIPEPCNVITKRARELFWMQTYSLQGKLYNEFQNSFSPTKQAIANGVKAARTSPKRQTDEYRAERSEIAKKGLTTPANKERNRQRLKALWQNPEFRAKKLLDLDKGRRNRVKR